MITKLICEGLKNNNGTEFNIIAIGKTSTRILLITNGYNVYDVPIDSFDGTHNKLYLPTKAIQLMDKYPILFKSQMLSQIRTSNKIPNAFIIYDGKNDWIGLQSWQSNKMFKLHYNIDTSEVFTKSYRSDKKNEVIVSSNKPRHYYSLVRVNNNLFMSIDRYDEDSDFSNMSIIPYEGVKHLICSRTNTTIRMEKGIKCRSGIPVQWPVLKGFASDGKFYLFGHSYIYIFDEDAYNNQGKEYPLQKISYDSYFICKDDKIPTEINREQRKQMDSKFAIKFVIEN